MQAKYRVRWAEAEFSCAPFFRPKSMTTLYCRSLAPNLWDMATIGMRWGREMEDGSIKNLLFIKISFPLILCTLL
jgi:hypothetical protein